MFSSGNAVGIGIFWMLIATVQWTGMDSLNKYLTQSYPITQIVMARFVIHTALVMLIWAPRLREFFFKASWKLQTARSVFMVAGTALVVLAFQHLPLLLVNATSQLTPVLVTALSVPLLKEKVGWRRWMGVAGGFAGALVVVGPASLAVSFLVLLPLGSAATGAFYQIITRQLGTRDSPETTIFHTALVGTVIGLLIVPLVWGGVIPQEAVWHNPDLMGWFWFLLLGILGVTSHYCMILAYTAAPASVIAPFSYIQLVWSALAGLAAFGEIPSPSTVAGGLMIAASGLYIFFREQKRKAQGLST